MTLLEFLLVFRTIQLVSQFHLHQSLWTCIIEKHFTLDKELPGWDHEISADPGTLYNMRRVKEHSYIYRFIYEKIV